MSGEITRLLNDSENPDALNQVIDMVYQDLRRIAANYLKGTPNRTLQPTDLVHEAYGELAKKSVLQFNDRAHFFGCASLIMRHLLYKYARDMKRLKRGGDQAKVSLDEGLVGGKPMDADALLSLQCAMEKLHQLDPEKHRLVELRSFLGLSMKEIATVTDKALRTVERDWQFCRVWLSRELQRPL
ncbi:ECF-type sigma factor [Acanthopleuribacter pedis]|uniref:Sigma-70 family RNA polymerase sigma factor n=1 Tax=Acanthopleuribacter pedis TaxID=442870 RepID=A0A8J7QRY4_9BACT|nr:ECF-type sigma factor [Acanthopleuribacter pedis]MBO1323435.1 sigma-70 family RNA polymerase sigma factor [Acanthopleuribacter pedis]